VKGINKAFHAFLGLTKEAGNDMKNLNTATQSVATTVQGALNKSLQSTATTMVELNTLMDQFNKKTELSAVRAQRLEKAREQAVREFGARGMRPNDQQVNNRVGQILSQQDREATRSRGLAIIGMEQQGKGNQLVSAVKSNPEQFTDAERKRILAMEKDITK